MGTAETAAAAGGASPPSLLLTAKSPPDAVAALAASLVPSWSDLPPSSLEVAVISGGITNALWSVAVKESPSVNENVSPRRVAVRAYGDRTDLLIDRALEVRTLLLLNAKGFGAKVLAGFEGGRVEEFLPGRALTPEETARPETAERIARGLARLHAVDFKKEKKKEKREGEKETSRFSLFPSSCLSLFSRRQRASSSTSSSSSLSSPLPPPPSEEEERVSAFVDQAELFSLAAHLFWTAWARVQVHVSPIDFDYAQYARSRFEDYGRRKKGAAAAFVARS